MNKLLSLLSDPYLHVIGIGALILALAAGAGSGGKTELASDGNHCELCSGSHFDSEPCLRVVSAPRSPLLETRN